MDMALVVVLNQLKLIGVAVMEPDEKEKGLHKNQRKEKGHDTNYIGWGT